MGDQNENKIRGVSTFIDYTSSIDDLFKILQEKNVFTEEEAEQISTADSLYEKKSLLYSFVINKDETAFDELINGLKATGHGEAADKLMAGEEVTVDVHEHDQQTQSLAEAPAPTQREADHEGIALADEIEKELERIQIQSDAENEGAPIDHEEEVEDHRSAEVVSVTDKVDVWNNLEQGYGPSSFEEPVSDVRVEVTSAEPEPEVEEEEVAVNNHVEEEVQLSEPEMEAPSASPEVSEAPSSPRTPKQVTFEDPKEFVINKEGNDDHTEDSESAMMARKSLVKVNREMFEKSAPGGKIKYSFNKKGETPAPDEPKESTVKNLRNFFQKLGSVENDDVLKRQGSKTGGVNPNRRTMAL